MILFSFVMVQNLSDKTKIKSIIKEIKSFKGFNNKKLL